MFDDFKFKLKMRASMLDIDINDPAAGQLFKYYSMLIEKNKFLNLTAITEEDDFINKHFIDSLVLSRTVPLDEKCYKIIDVGTGAGFPGLVLKIVYPGIDIVLFDSLRKRLNFIDDVISELKLVNVRTLHGRAEDFGRDPEHREKYDIVVSRAVASLPVLLEYCVPFVKPGGFFAAYKSADCDQEIAASANAFKLLGCGKVNKNYIKLPETDITRCIITVDKKNRTNMKFPRRAGKPSASPL